MWLKVIFLFISTSLAFSVGQTVTISCNYRQYSQDYPYTCDLTIINPNGLDTFDSIQGNHLEGRGNLDVLVVNGYNQNSRNIPSIICRQFPNLQRLYLSSSNVAFINETAFAECQNLQDLMLSLNEIEAIPENTFRNNANLDTILLSTNNINSISVNSFTGTRARYISLGINRLGSYNPEWFESVAETLEILEVLVNDFATLPSNAFSNLPRLKFLDITGNKFTNLPADVFTGLTNLETMYFTDCGVSVLNPAWFTEMPRMDELHLDFNGISNLPDGVFGSLRRLREVFLGNNNLTQAGLSAFGRTVATLEVIALDNNPVIAVDRELFTRARNLRTFALYNAVCHNSNIYNPSENMNQALQVLLRCFLNFGPEIINCRYAPDSRDDYSCSLDIRNPNGNDFDAIAGDHLTDRGDDDVLTVFATERSTLAIPSVICRQFRQLRTLVVLGSFVQNLNQQSFNDCRNIELLDLTFNEISSIGDNTFANNPLLREVILARNAITMLSENAFSGTAIRILDLSYNRLFTFNSEWDQPIAETLETLDLSYNNIQIIQNNTFGNLRNLRRLNLNNNFIYDINANSFSNLVNLERLSLAGIGLRELNSEWFSTLTNLVHLSVANNQLENFPINIFHSLVNLEELYFYNNRIIEIRADSFGASLPSLAMLYGSTNMINSFDPEILNRATQMSSLLFYGNLCTQLNIFDVRGNVSHVETQLATCTNNFRIEPALSCEYIRMITNRFYWCELTMSNPSGRDNIDSVAGEHLPGSNNDSVSYVKAENQSSFVVPSTLCRQFGSLQILDLLHNEIHELGEDSFRNCRFLRELMLIGSTIRRIPERTFQGAPNLLVVQLDANGIEFIGATAFAGTQIHTLDLSHNEIHDFIPETYAAIGATLEILRLTDNRLERLPPRAFDQLPNLIDLELNHNHFFTLPSGVFNIPVNLQILQISNCGLETIQPGLFSRLTNLRDLELSLNDFDFLPENIFDLPNLEIIGLVQNNLQTLDIAAFGRSLGSLLSIDASVNRITAVDAELISENSNLRNLNLAYNQCTEGTFINIPTNRDQVRISLQNCINNFNNVLISCEFSEDEAIYECELTLNNVINRLRFENVGGEHLEGKNDNFVTNIRALNQNSRSIPSILCQQFRNVESIYFLASNLEVVSSDAFSSCENLYSINLSGNRLLDIPDNTFSANQYLSALTLATNNLNTLRPSIFQGTQIYYLDIENNNFRNFNPTWLAPIAPNLRYLILRNNEIQRLPRNAFSMFRSLAYLELSGNNQIFVPSNAFEDLQNLYNLEMANCGINELNPHWFKNFPFLHRLEVDMNGITELPQGIFDIPLLGTLGIAFNNITVLDSRAFGSSLDSILSLDAEENQINAIDRVVVSNATALNNLMLIGNSCVNSNFIDVQENMDQVLGGLEGCFNNFSNL